MAEKQDPQRGHVKTFFFLKKLNYNNIVEERTQGSHARCLSNTSWATHKSSLKPKIRIKKHISYH